jgi:hypothetical protein
MRWVGSTSSAWKGREVPALGVSWWPCRSRTGEAGATSSEARPHPVPGPGGRPGRRGGPPEVAAAPREDSGTSPEESAVRREESAAPREVPAVRRKSSGHAGIVRRYRGKIPGHRRRSPRYAGNFPRCRRNARGTAERFRGTPESSRGAAGTSRDTPETSRGAAGGFRGTPGTSGGGPGRGFQGEGFPKLLTRFAFLSPPPLVGGGRGGGAGHRIPRPGPGATTRPPTPTLPHEGGGSQKASRFTVLRITDT